MNKKRRKRLEKRAWKRGYKQAQRDIGNRVASTTLVKELTACSGSPDIEKLVARACILNAWIDEGKLP